MIMFKRIRRNRKEFEGCCSAKNDGADQGKEGAGCSKGLLRLKNNFN
jgi:hypothetical protein